MKYLLNDHEDHLNQHKNSHKPHDETGQSVSSLWSSQWKLRQQHDNFMNSRILSDTCKSSRNREPFHKSSYNQSRPFPYLYVSSYSHTVSSYQLIIDLWSLYFFPASFSWTGRLSFTSKNCKYFQK